MEIVTGEPHGAHLPTGALPGGPAVPVRGDEPAGGEQVPKGGRVLPVRKRKLPAPDPVVASGLISELIADQRR